MIAVMGSSAQRAIARRQFIDLGLCRCGSEKVIGSTQCEVCKAGDRNRRARAKSKGLCGICHKSPLASDGGNCYLCRDKILTKVIQRRAEGKCPCGQPREPEHRYCARCANLGLAYYDGLTVAGYAALFLAQGGKCYICRKPPSVHRRLSVDHNHRTGRIRKLLCTRCNNGLGLFKESIPALRAAIRYLKEHEDGNA